MRKKGRSRRTDSAAPAQPCPYEPSMCSGSKRDPDRHRLVCTFNPANLARDAALRAEAAAARAERTAAAKAVQAAARTAAQAAQADARAAAANDPAVQARLAANRQATIARRQVEEQRRRQQAEQERLDAERRLAAAARRAEARAAAAKHNESASIAAGGLPTETLRNVFSHAAIPDLLQISWTCRRWRAIADDGGGDDGGEEHQNLWRRRLFDTYYAGRTFRAHRQNDWWKPYSLSRRSPEFADLEWHGGDKTVAADASGRQRVSYVLRAPSSPTDDADCDVHDHHPARHLTRHTDFVHKDIRAFFKYFDYKHHPRLFVMPQSNAPGLDAIAEAGRTGWKRFAVLRAFHLDPDPEAVRRLGTGLSTERDTDANKTVERAIDIGAEGMYFHGMAVPVWEERELNTSGPTCWTRKSHLRQAILFTTNIDLAPGFTVLSTSTIKFREMQGREERRSRGRNEAEEEEEEDPDDVGSVYRFFGGSFFGPVDQSEDEGDGDNDDDDGDEESSHDVCYWGMDDEDEREQVDTEDLNADEDFRDDGGRDFWRFVGGYDLDYRYGTAEPDWDAHRWNHFCRWLFSVADKEVTISDELFFNFFK